MLKTYHYMMFGIVSVGLVSKISALALLLECIAIIFNLEFILK